MFDNWFKRPQIVVPTVARTVEKQAAVDSSTTDLALYYSDGCLFCTRVRKVIVALDLHIELRDIRADGQFYRDLFDFGGRVTVPCLRIGKAIDPATARWMYESRDIITYLIERFGPAR